MISEACLSPESFEASSTHIDETIPNHHWSKWSRFSWSTASASMLRFLKLRQVCLSLDHYPQALITVDKTDFTFILFLDPNESPSQHNWSWRLILSTRKSTITIPLGVLLPSRPAWMRTRPGHRWSLSWPNVQLLVPRSFSYRIPICTRISGRRDWRWGSIWCCLGIQRCMFDLWSYPWIHSHFPPLLLFSLCSSLLPMTLSPLQARP